MWRFSNMSNNLLAMSLVLILSYPTVCFGEVEGTGDPALPIAVDYDRQVELALSSSESSYLKELVLRARSSGLANSPVWLALLHYRFSLLYGRVSQVDSDDFFLSSRGKIDPEKELAATIAGFFSQTPVAPSSLAPQCRFIARFTWLKQQLPIDMSRLPLVSCESYQTLYEALDPKSLTLVYVAANAKSQSTLFGQLLLRIDKKTPALGSDLTAYSISYSPMEAKSVNPVVYSGRLLMGGVLGLYSILPYHSRMHAYSRIERRDLWEYRLKLESEQIDLILKHAFELGWSYFDYFLLGENGASQLLALLDVAVSPSPLLGYSFLGNLPIDAVKRLGDLGLIEAVTYEPSQATTIRYKRQPLSRYENDLVMRLYADGLDKFMPEFDNLAAERKVLIYELLQELQRFDRIVDPERQESALTAEEQAVLVKRGEIRLPSPGYKIPPATLRPDWGHDRFRLGLGFGREGSGDFTQFEWRAADHDLLDPGSGYALGYGLTLLDLQGRHYDQQKQAYLNRVTWVDYTSLAPRDTFFRDWSWTFNAAWQSNLKPDDKQSGFSEFDGGMGGTLSLPGLRNSLTYALFKANLKLGNAFLDGYDIAFGFRAGWLWRVFNRWSLHAYGEYYHSPAVMTKGRPVVSVEQSLELSRSTALRIDWHYSFSEGASEESFLAQFHYYF